MSTTAAKPDRSGAFLSVFVVAVVMGTYWVTAPILREQVAVREELKTHLVARDCVVAHMDGRTVDAYRCDKPLVGQHVEAAVLWAEAKTALEARKTR